MFYKIIQSFEKEKKEKNILRTIFDRVLYYPKRIIRKKSLNILSSNPRNILCVAIQALVYFT